MDDCITRLRFLENLEKVDRAIRRADGLEQMLEDTVRTVLSVFEADRVFLFHPCEPDAASYRVPMECTRPGYPGAYSMGVNVTASPAVRNSCREMLEAKGPTSYGAGSEKPVPEEQQAQFSVKSILCMPIFPKVGAPWAVGMHQCSRERKWSEVERQLFQEIGRRLADALSSFLSLRDLRESETRFRALVDNMPGAVYRCDVEENGDWTVRFVSEQFLEVTSYPVSRFLGTSIQNFFKIVYPGDLEKVRKVVTEGGKQNKTFSIEFRIVTDDGSLRWIYQRGRPIADHRGVIRCFDGVFLNITKRKLAEEALRQSEVKYRALFEWSADPMLLIDGDTFVNCNAAAVQMLRCKSKDELLQMHPWDISPEFQPDGMSSRKRGEETLASMPQERSRRFEWIHRRADGELFPAEVLLTYVPIGEKPLIHVAWRDLTELKKAEGEARHLRNLLKNIVNSMPSVLIGIDVETNVTQWNQMAQKATGIPPEDAQGKSLLEVFPKLAGHLAQVRQSIADRRAITDPKIPENVDGEIRFSDITTYPLITNGIDGAVIRIDDTTERVRIEEMMVQSEKMLSVGGLAAGMAHEINNPLAGILQSIQVVLDRLSPDLPANKQDAENCNVNLASLDRYLKLRNVFDLLEGVRGSGRRAARIVDNMLSFSRKSNTRFENSNIAELLDRTLELAVNDYVLKKELHFRDISITLQYDPDLPDVPCEKTEIQQVILNILKNGAHAMLASGPPRQAPCFIIRTSQEGGMARIEIQDNGPGMSEEVRRRIFEPFYTTKSIDLGTGLGLSVSYFIVTENHRGKLSVVSAPGQGANFIIQLPLKRK